MAGHMNDNAIYLIGSSGENFVFLDPHKIGDKVIVTDKTMKEFVPTHCSVLNTAGPITMSSAVACGFQIRSMYDFGIWKH